MNKQFSTLALALTAIISPVSLAGGATEAALKYTHATVLMDVSDIKPMLKSSDGNGLVEVRRTGTVLKVFRGNQLKQGDKLQYTDWVNVRNSMVTATPKTAMAVNLCFNGNEWVGAGKGTYVEATPEHIEELSKLSEENKNFNQSARWCRGQILSSSY